jgi:hypothetical protein
VKFKLDSLIRDLLGLGHGSNGQVVECLTSKLKVLSQRKMRSKAMWATGSGWEKNKEEVGPDVRGGLLQEQMGIWLAKMKKGCAFKVKVKRIGYIIRKQKVRLTRIKRALEVGFRSTIPSLTGIKSLVWQYSVKRTMQEVSQYLTSNYITKQ